jgi:large subunit ribosomal protein L6
MSRIGKMPIAVPGGVEVNVEGTTLRVKGSKGELSRTFSDRVAFELTDGTLTVRRVDDSREARALHGLTRALVANMVTGVSEGYTKGLEIVGVGYRAAMKGSALELQLGFSHPVVVEPPAGITFEVPEPTKINVIGIDKELVGQVAADIRKIRPPEPYKGKRYAGEVVRRKAGKAGK